MRRRPAPVRGMVHIPLLLSPLSKELLDRSFHSDLSHLVLLPFPSSSKNAPSDSLLVGITCLPASIYATTVTNCITAPTVSANLSTGLGSPFGSGIGKPIPATSKEPCGNSPATKSYLIGSVARDQIAGNGGN